MKMIQFAYIYEINLFEGLAEYIFPDYTFRI